MNLKKVGNFLSTERKRRRKTIRQISAITRISLLRLKQIEAGEQDPKLAPVYIQGYIRSYAKCLKIDEEQLLRLLHSQSVEEKKNLKLAQPKKIDKSLIPILNVANISMSLAICLFAGLIGWTRFMIDKYNIQSAEQNLEVGVRNLSQISLEPKSFCRDNNLPSYLKASCSKESFKNDKKNNKENKRKEK